MGFTKSEEEKKSRNYKKQSVSKFSSLKFQNDHGLTYTF